MADRRTLIERLHRPVPPGGSERAQLTQSILQNLGQVFCSFPGSMRAELPSDRVRFGMPTLGVTLHPDLVGHAEESPDAALREDLPTRIRNLIRTFEPRLRPESVSVDVSADPHRPGVLMVSLNAQMWMDRADVGVFRMSAEVSADGHLVVEGR